MIHDEVFNVAPSLRESRRDISVMHAYRALDRRFRRQGRRSDHELRGFLLGIALSAIVGGILSAIALGLRKVLR